MNYEQEVFPTTRAVSAYISETGFLVIEQEAEDHQEKDQMILIHPRDVSLFLRAISNLKAK